MAFVAAVGLFGCSQTATDDATTSEAGETASQEPAANTVDSEQVDTSSCQEAVELLHAALVQRTEDLQILVVDWGLFLADTPADPLAEWVESVEKVETADELNSRIEDVNAALADCPGADPVSPIEADDMDIPTPEPIDEPEPAQQLTEDDFSITLFVTRNRCFNSAGSSVRFEPELAVENPDSLQSVSGTLVYEVLAGDESLGTFSIELQDDGTYSYSEESGSPDACYEDNEITAEVIRVRKR